MTGEVRIPARMLHDALADKNTKALHFLANAKLEGHRSQIDCLCSGLKFHPRKCKRLVDQLVVKGWAGSDGAFLFPRAWKKLKFSKRGGLYLTKVPNDIKKFEALCFAKALKKIYRKRGGLHSKKGRVLQEDLPARYLYKSLGISERRFERLKAQAQKYKFISVKTPPLSVVGTAKQFNTLRKHLKVPMFVLGKNTVAPGRSQITVKI